MGPHIRGMAAGWLCATLVACSGTHNASGTYVGHSPDSAVMLQIVETSDGRISGQMTAVGIEADGQLKDFNASLSGAVSGNSVTLEARPTALLPVGVQLSGTFDREQMTLNTSARGGAISIGTLQRADVAGFQAAAATLRAASQKIVEANAQAQAQQQAAEEKARITAQHGQQAAAINSLTNQIGKTLERLGKYESVIDGYVPRYQAIANKIKRYLDQERNLVGPQYSYQRGQLSYAVSSESFEAGNLHFNQISLSNDFNQAVQDISGEVGKAFEICRRTPQLNANDPVAQDAALWSACQRLYPARQSVSAAADKTRQRFAAAEIFYAQEKQQNASIAKEASRLVR